VNDPVSEFFRIVGARSPTLPKTPVTNSVAALELEVTRLRSANTTLMQANERQAAMLRARPEAADPSEMTVDELSAFLDKAEAILYKGKLHIGCQTLDAKRAFKNLGKALGYEITG
jgi:hypothetical protein